LSGVFDAYPKLKIILGHLGEGLPFYLWRIDQTLARDGDHAKGFRDKFLKHFYITTSGFFSSIALDCCIQEIGLERIMFSVDYPYVDNKPGTDWALHELKMSDADRASLLSGNAKRILKLK
jgi:2,3-dihydroxybenzoate decarboxylase